jgi:hypothetical protein
MFIPNFVSQRLRAILANLDQDLRKESQITHDLGEHFATSRITTVLVLSEQMCAQMHPPRKIVRSRSNRAAKIAA